MRVTVILSIFFLLFISSCSKSEIEISREDLLTAGKWQITAYTERCTCSDGMSFGISFSAYNTRDIYAKYPACTKDDYFVFYKGGTVEVNEGPTKCYPAKAQSYTESWSFNSDASRFLFDGEEWSISQLDKTTFAITTVKSLFGTGKRITFSKI